MNKQIRELERQSGIDVYGLGRDRVKWELALETYSQMLVRECILTIQLKIVRNGPSPENTRSWQHVKDIAEKFSLHKEPKNENCN